MLQTLMTVLFWVVYLLGFFGSIFVVIKTTWKWYRRAVDLDDETFRDVVTCSACGFIFGMIGAMTMRAFIV